MGVSGAHRSGLLERLPLGASVLVDTNPLIYVLEGAPLAERFAPLFAAADRGDYELIITPITLAEIAAGPLRAGNEALTERYASALTRPPFRLREIDAAIALNAARLRIRYCLKLPDALQLATALHEGCAAIVTHDRGFAGVGEIAVLGME